MSVKRTPTALHASSEPDDFPSMDEVAAEEARILAIAMAEAAQATLEAMRNASKPTPKTDKTKKAHPIPNHATPCSCSQCQLESAVQSVGKSVGSNDADWKAHPLLPAYLCRMCATRRSFRMHRSKANAAARRRTTPKGMPVRIWIVGIEGSRTQPPMP